MSKNRSEHIKIYLTEEEKKKVKEISEKTGLNVSSWARAKIKESIPMVAQ